LSVYQTNVDPPKRELVRQSINQSELTQTVNESVSTLLVCPLGRRITSHIISESVSQSVGQSESVRVSQSVYQLVS